MGDPLSWRVPLLNSEGGHPPRWTWRATGGCVRLTFPFLLGGAPATVPQALLAFHLDDCRVLHMGLPLKTAQKLQPVQHAAVRATMGTSGCGPFAVGLSWFPAKLWVLFKVPVAPWCPGGLSLPLGSARPVCQPASGPIRPATSLASTRRADSALHWRSLKDQPLCPGAGEGVGQAHGERPASPVSSGLPVRPSGPCGDLGR